MPARRPSQPHGLCIPTRSLSDRRRGQHAGSCRVPKLKHFPQDLSKSELQRLGCATEDANDRPALPEPRIPCFTILAQLPHAVRQVPPNRRKKKDNNHECSLVGASGSRRKIGAFKVKSGRKNPNAREAGRNHHLNLQERMKWGGAATNINQSHWLWTDPLTFPLSFKI
jgi:hypothetical protein